VVVVEGYSHFSQGASPQLERIIQCWPPARRGSAYASERLMVPPTAELTIKLIRLRRTIIPFPG
jgi:hypothetical protein